MQAIKNLITDNPPFLRWWILACCLVTVFSGIVITGGGTFLAENDATGISWIIIAILASGSAHYGYRLFRGQNIGQGVMDYLGELCTSLGLLGTVIGLIMMISGAFGSIQLENPESVKLALVAMSSGIGSALTTTLVGLIASIVLGLQKKLVEINWS
jgi:hypothetical protein